jgi:hypothetical protein
MTIKREPRQTTWIEVGVRNAGIRKTMTALTWAHLWAVVREATGHDPTVEEVAAWWREPERTAYREQAAFRAAFPKLDTPAVIYEDPEVRAKIARAIKAVDAHRDARARRKVPDVDILAIGMATARF